jgi:hypothetical protein
MMDYINYRRYKIVKQKTVKSIRNHGFGTTGTVPLLETFSGQLDGSGKMCSMRIPGAKFGKNGNIMYTDQGGSFSSLKYCYV